MTGVQTCALPISALHHHAEHYHSVGGILGMDGVGMFQFITQGDEVIEDE